MQQFNIMPDAHASTTPLRDRMLVDLLDELEFALAVIEATERRSRSPASSARLNMAATAVTAATAKLAIAHPNIIGVGDGLFHGALGQPCQTYRHI